MKQVFTCANFRRDFRITYSKKHVRYPALLEYAEEFNEMQSIVNRTTTAILAAAFKDKIP